MGVSSGELPIQAENLGKCFRFYENKWQKLRGAFLHTGNHAQQIWALRHLNLTVPSGTTVGVIGQNGSGKTTLLQLLAGLLKPTEGELEVRGNLATLLELESGFQHELTGRENIFVSAGLRGFSKREIERKMDNIVAFSELEKFIDHPIKHYSSGMLMRLAFATAINVEPDVLLVDEVFAVGDMAFQHKCARKFRELQKKETTIVLVTHDMTALKSLCNTAVLLDQGLAIHYGPPEEVANHYLNLITQRIAQQSVMEAGPQTAEQLPTFQGEFLSELPDSGKMHRHGSGEGKIRALQILNSKMLPSERVSFGEEVTFRFYIEYLADVAGSGLGFFLRDRYGNDIIGVNTFEEREPLGDRKKGDRIIVDFRLPLYLRPGTYSVSPGFSYHPSEPRYLDWIDNAMFFEMGKPAGGQQIHGFVYVPTSVSVQIAR
jgi:lipopolysaccharide transport system ATP-binding protein